MLAIIMIPNMQHIFILWARKLKYICCYSPVIDDYTEVQRRCKA